MSLALAGCGVEDERQLYPPRWASSVIPALACLPQLSPSPFPPCSEPIAFLTHANPTLLSQAKTTPRASSWLGASSTTRMLGLSFRNTVFPSCRPIAPHCFWVCVFTRPYSLRVRALSLSFSLLCPVVWLCLPPPLSSCLSCSTHPLSAWPFPQGSLHLAHLSLPSSLRVSGAVLGALAPAPGPSFLSFLLSSWKVQIPHSRLGGRGSRWVLWAFVSDLTQHACLYPHPTPTCRSLDFWSRCVVLEPTSAPLSLPGLTHSLWDLQRLGFHDGGSGAPVALDGGDLPIAPCLH